VLCGRAIWTVNIHGWFFCAVAGVAGGVFDAMQSDKGVGGNWFHHFVLVQTLVLIGLGSQISLACKILSYLLSIRHLQNYGVKTRGNLMGQEIPSYH
jgi:hypothetical protein